MHLYPTLPVLGPCRLLPQLCPYPLLLFASFQAAVGTLHFSVNPCIILVIYPLYCSLNTSLSYLLIRARLSLRKPWDPYLFSLRFVIE